MTPSHEPEETIIRFEKPLVALARTGVDFALVGGLAVILNGYPRTTLDVDIVVSPAPENIRLLIATLSGWGEGWARELTVADFASMEEGAVRVMEEFDLDIFVRMRGRTLEDFRPELRFLAVANVRIPYISPAALIHCKADSWREKDRLDVLAMLEIQRREAGDSTG